MLKSITAKRHLFFIACIALIYLFSPVNDRLIAFDIAYSKGGIGPLELYEFLTFNILLAFLVWSSFYFKGAKNKTLCVMYGIAIVVYNMLYAELFVVAAKYDLSVYIKIWLDFIALMPTLLFLRYRSTIKRASINWVAKLCNRLNSFVDSWQLPLSRSHGESRFFSSKTYHKINYYFRYRFKPRLASSIENYPARLLRSAMPTTFELLLFGLLKNYIKFLILFALGLTAYCLYNGIPSHASIYQFQVDNGHISYLLIFLCMQAFFHAYYISIVLICAFKDWAIPDYSPRNLQSTQSK